MPAHYWHQLLIFGHRTRSSIEQPATMSQIKHFSSLMPLTVGYKDEPSTSTTSYETISHGWTSEHRSIGTRSDQFTNEIFTSEIFFRYRRHSQVLLLGGPFLASGLLLKRFRNVMTLSNMTWPCIYYLSGVPSPGASNRSLCAGNTIRLSPTIWDKRRHLIILLDLFDLRSSPHRSRMPDRIPPPFNNHPTPDGWRHTINNQFDNEYNLLDLRPPVFRPKRRWLLHLNLAWLAKLLVVLMPEDQHYISINIFLCSFPASHFFLFFFCWTQVPTAFLLSSFLFIFLFRPLRSLDPGSMQTL